MEWKNWETKGGEECKKKISITPPPSSASQKKEESPRGKERGGSDNLHSPLGRSFRPPGLPSTFRKKTETWRKKRTSDIFFFREGVL